MTDELPVSRVRGWTIGFTSSGSASIPASSDPVDPAVSTRLRELVVAAQARFAAADVELRDAEAIIREQLAEGRTAEAIAEAALLTLESVQRVADGGRLVQLGG